MPARRTNRSQRPRNYTHPSSQVTDCTDNGNGTSTGCEGGLMTTAFKYLIGNHGIDSEKDYQYVGLNSPCWAAAEARHVADMDAFKTVPIGSEAQLAAAIARGPVAVGIEADQAGFQHYSNGRDKRPSAFKLPVAARY